MQDATDILAEKDVQAQLEEETRVRKGLRHCSNCGKTGHNSRTCQEDVCMDNVSDFN